MRVLLCCGFGASTSLLANAVFEKLSDDEKKESRIEAISYKDFDEKAPEFDVILLGPQITYKYDDLKERANKLGKPLGMINSIDYATVNGENVLKQVKKMLQSSVCS